MIAFVMVSFKMFVCVCVFVLENPFNIPWQTIKWHWMWKPHSKRSETAFSNNQSTILLKMFISFTENRIHSHIHTHTHTLVANWKQMMEDGMQENTVTFCNNETVIFNRYFSKWSFSTPILWLSLWLHTNHHIWCI